MDDRIVRAQDAPYVFIEVAKNSLGRTVVWEFFQSSWAKIFET